MSRAADLYFESARVPKKVYAGVSHTERFRKWALGTGGSYTSKGKCWGRGCCGGEAAGSEAAGGEAAGGEAAGGEAAGAEAATAEEEKIILYLKSPSTVEGTRTIRPRPKLRTRTLQWPIVSRPTKRSALAATNAAIQNSVQRDATTTRLGGKKKTN